MRLFLEKNSIKRRNDNIFIDPALLNNSIREISRWTFGVDNIMRLYKIVMRRFFRSETPSKVFDLIYKAFMN